MSKSNEPPDSDDKAHVDRVVMPCYRAKVDRETLEQVLTNVVTWWVSDEARVSYREAIANALTELEASA